MPCPAGARAYEYQCYSASAARPCSPYAACTAYDDTQCGFQYSSAQQAAFCEVREPGTWPALVQVGVGGRQLGPDAGLPGLLPAGACTWLATWLGRACLRPTGAEQHALPLAMQFMTYTQTAHLLLLARLTWLLPARPCRCP